MEWQALEGMGGQVHRHRVPGTTSVFFEKTYITQGMRNLIGYRQARGVSW
jgi:hypothetical protein